MPFTKDQRFITKEWVYKENYRPTAYIQTLGVSEQKKKKLYLDVICNTEE